MSDIKKFIQQRMEFYMQKYGLDILIGSLPENIYYLTGFRSISHNILQRNQAYALVSCDNERSLVISRADVPTVIEQIGEIKISCYGHFYFEISNDHRTSFTNINYILESTFDTPEHALVGAIKDAVGNKRRIGLDESRISIQSWERLKAAFPNTEFIPAANIFSEIRMVKHEDEIVFLERAAEIAEESLLTALSKLEIGMSEAELCDLYRENIVAMGADPYFHVFTEGTRSALADTINTNQKIIEGSILRFDIGCVFKGYKSDIARTAVVGKISTKATDYYRSILEGEEAAIDSIKPGVTAEEIFDIAMKKTIEGIPHYRRHHCGHGIGLEIYDFPSIAKGSKTELEPGMVLCIETPYYELGWAGVQVEDTVVVTGNGSRYLSKSSRELIKIGG
ncbi:Xaa-Pro peptidase family protein [Neobacillus niacini]|uniref:Xaa-Pro peptidase family protein n=1 Tax=Neobacillus niacini TaxID=86668 RepID=UPI003002DA7C